MPLDSICLRALCAELNKEIVGLKVDKVQQPEKDRLLLLLRGQGKTRRLLISCAAGSARMCLTEESYENPAAPPMLCMLLRKQLTGARVAELSQPGLERVLDLRLDAQDQLGYACERHILFEAMGRYSNMILTDGDGIIIECLHRLEGQFTESRMILPGLKYRLPPPQKKANPLAADEETVRRMMTACGDCELSEWLLQNFTGLSPLVCRELALRAAGSSDYRIYGGADEALCRKTAAVLQDLSAMVRTEQFTPVMLCGEEGKPKDFSYMKIAQYGGAAEQKVWPDFSGMLEAFYVRRDRAERMRQRTQTLTKSVKTVYDRIGRRLALQKQELEKTYGREALRRCGDLITANLYRMSKGMRTLETEDFYQEEQPVVTIRLDPLKTPQQNAARYYKDYNKAKTAETVLTKQVEEGERDYRYLASVLEEIERAESERDIAEIRQELTDTGFLRRRSDGKKERRVEQKPMHFRSTAGLDIFVGKNNAQNDRLTLKDAMKRDWWLHAQKIHGSHVIIAGGEPDEQTLLEAASLAALYSRGREAGTVPVDYTMVRNVRKMPGGKPGMVVYTDYKTILVRPDEALAEKLRVR